MAAVERLQDEDQVKVKEDRILSRGAKEPHELGYEEWKEEHGYGKR